MLQPGGEADLPLEPLEAETRGQVGMEYLDGDRPVVAEVVREIHGRHAAAAELALESVPVLECAGEFVERIGQG
jgi:hypothetical protein